MGRKGGRRRRGDERTEREQRGLEMKNMWGGWESQKTGVGKEGIKRREEWEAEEKGGEQREKRGGKRREGRGREEEEVMDGKGGVHPTGTKGLQVTSTFQLHLEASCSSHPQDALLQLDTKFPEPCPTTVQAPSMTDNMADKHRVCPVGS